MSKKRSSYLKTTISSDSEPVIVAIVTTVPAVRARGETIPVHPEDTPQYFQRHTAGVHSTDTLQALQRALTDWLFAEAMSRGPENGLLVLDEFCAASRSAVDEARSLIGVSFKHWGKLSEIPDVLRPRLLQTSFNSQIRSADREEFEAQLPGRAPTPEEARELVAHMFALRT